MQEPSRDQGHASTWYLPSFSNLLSCKTAVSLETPASSDIISTKADITSRAFWLTNLQQICKLLSIANPKPSGSVSSSDAAHKRFVVDLLRRLHKTFHPLLCKVVHRSVHETTKNLCTKSHSPHQKNIQIGVAEPDTSCMALSSTNP